MRKRLRNGPFTFRIVCKGPLQHAPGAETAATGNLPQFQLVCEADCALWRGAEFLHDHGCRDHGAGDDQLDEFGQSRRGTAAGQLAHHPLPRVAQPVVFLHAGQRRLIKTVEKCEDALCLVPGVPPLPWDGTKTGAQGRQVIGRDGAIAQKSRGQKPPKPGAALEHLLEVPGGDVGDQHARRVGADVDAGAEHSAGAMLP